MSTGSPPPAPDYTGAAKATAEGNLEAARYATQANRPTQITPWGTLSWTNDGGFDQTGYDAALQSYQQALAGLGGQPAGSPLGGQQRFVQTFDGSGNDNDTGRLVPFNGGTTAVNQKAPAGLRAPNVADFTRPGDNWTQTVTLSPEMQALFNQQNSLQQGMFSTQDAALQRVQQALGQGFNTSGLPGMPSSFDLNRLKGLGNLPGLGAVFDPASAGQAGAAFQAPGSALAVYDPNQVTNNATELIMSRLAPELDRQQNSLQTQLANQGALQGSAAYNNALNNFGQARNDAQQQAALAGITLGMQQQGQQFGQGLQNRQLLASEQNQQFGQTEALRQMAAALQAQQFGQSATNQQLGLADRQQQLTAQQQLIAAQQQQFGQQMAARNNALQEQAFLRNLPLNELNALRSGNQVSMPQFQGFAQQATTQGPDLLGAANSQYNAALGAYNADQAGGSNMMNGILGLGGSLLKGAGAAGGLGALFTL